MIRLPITMPVLGRVRVLVVDACAGITTLDCRRSGARTRLVQTPTRQTAGSKAYLSRVDVVAGSLGDREGGAPGSWPWSRRMRSQAVSAGSSKSNRTLRFAVVSSDMEGWYYRWLIGREWLIRWVLVQEGEWLGSEV
jgi:hypothetical protein